MIYIVFAIVVALLAALLITKFIDRKEPVKTETQDRPDDCCGAHEVCETDSLLSSEVTIEYYNDEELDVYKGTDIHSYSDEQIEEFRDVLLTLQEKEVAGWLKSIQLRGITLPETIREEALLIVRERRFADN
jgi:uncharacterized membrane protein YraQ (UPF0718 family)